MLLAPHGESIDIVMDRYLMRFNSIVEVNETSHIKHTLNSLDIL